jgi:hypothetical protein
MALKISLAKSQFGIPFPEAYARITQVTVLKGYAYYAISISANTEARISEAADVSTITLSAPLPDGNLLQGLYAHLKTCAGFEGAEDC